MHHLKAALIALTVLVVVAADATLDPSTAGAEQAGSKIHRRASGFLAAGARFSCARLDTGRVRCWGRGSDGALGYGNAMDIGDTETPGSVGPIDLGAGRTARALAAGLYHACAILDHGQVRCWGASYYGELGYGNRKGIGDDETPGSVGPVDLGSGRSAVAITGGGYHTCAILDNGRVRCWGRAFEGQLGYGNQSLVGDNETPGSVGPVDLGQGRTAVAITGGGFHTCAILDNGKVRCWGEGGQGPLGYGNQKYIGDDETPASVGPVKLGAGRKAIAISAAGRHTCAVLNNRKVLCWGTGKYGQLGYGNTRDVGDNESPGSVGPVKLGAGRKAVAIQTGGRHTFALLDDGRLRSWGLGSDGQLGYANTKNIGDNEKPASAGPISLAGLVATR
jgi:alpha-tubulin suppressor-like RCC1 family protein